MFCFSLSGLFVNVGENASILDQLKLTFVYDEIGHEGRIDHLDEVGVSSLSLSV